MNTKLSLKSGDKLRCHQALSPIKCFDNSPFPLRVEKEGDQEEYIRMTVSATFLRFKAKGCFWSERKMKKQKQLNFSCFSQTWLPIPSQLPRQQQLSSFFGSISKLRTINIKDQKEGKATRHSRHSNYSPWRREC